MGIKDILIFDNFHEDIGLIVNVFSTQNDTDAFRSYFDRYVDHEKEPFSIDSEKSAYSRKHLVHRENCHPELFGNLKFVINFWEDTFTIEKIITFRQLFFIGHIEPTNPESATYRLLKNVFSVLGLCIIQSCKYTPSADPYSLGHIEENGRQSSSYDTNCPYDTIYPLDPSSSCSHFRPFSPFSHQLVAFSYRSVDIYSWWDPNSFENVKNVTNFLGTYFTSRPWILFSENRTWLHFFSLEESLLFCLIFD